MSTTLECAYCGEEYPQGTPPSNSDVLTQHICVCQKHPIRKLEADYIKVRSALAFLVGANDLETLQGMKITLKLMPDCDDKFLTLGAIDALIDTL